MLSDLADIHYGKSPNAVRDKYGSVPIVGTGGITGYANQSMFSGPAVVVGRKGTLDKPIYLDEAFWPIDTTYAVLPKTGVNARWLYYSLCNTDLRKLNEATGVPSIGRDFLARTDFFTPSNKDEQKAIATVLDTVDEAIQSTQAMLDKQDKITQGLLHDLLTRGVDERSHLRPSPETAPDLYQQTEIGLIPKEWEATNFGNELEVLYRYPSYYGIQYQNSGVTEVRGEMIVDGFISESNCEARYITQETAEKFSKVCLEIGDFVMTVRGTMGKIGLVDDKYAGGVITANLIRLKFSSKRISSDWMRHYLLSDLFSQALDNASSSTTIKTIKAPEIRDIKFSRPSIPEQKKISKILSTKSEAIAELFLDLQKLQKLKSGLMQDLLTGRRRVTPGLMRDVEKLAEAA